MAFMKLLVISAKRKESFPVFVSAFEEKDIQWEILQYSSCGAALSEHPPDVVFLGPDLSNGQIEECETLFKTGGYKGLTVLVRDGAFSVNDTVTWLSRFNHFIPDCNNQKVVAKKVSNLVSLHKLKKEKKRLRKIEKTLEEESAKLVEVNVNNVKLIAEVNKQNKVVEIARKDLQTLLDNLGQGFLTIDENGIIQPGWSRAVEVIFEMKPEGKRFSDLLRLDDHDAVSNTDWLEMVFNELLPFKDLAALGYQHVEINNKWIELDYRPIKSDDNGFEKLIVVATDKTVEHELAAKAEKEEQFAQMVLSITRDRGAFLDFYYEAHSLLDKLKKQFAQPDNINIAECFRLAHTLKGNAGAFHLDEVKHCSHRLEDALGQLRSAENQISLFQQNSKEYESILSKLDSTFRESIALIENTVGKFGDETNAVKEVNISEIEQLRQFLFDRYATHKELLALFCSTLVHEPVEKYLRRFIPQITGIAQRMEKEVEVQVKAGGMRFYLDPYKSLMQSFIHIFRNALDHGIELPDEREVTGKSRQGHITIVVKNTDVENQICFIIQDDGRGIDVSRVKDKAIQKRIHTEQEAAHLSREQILSLLFHPGFSTNDEVSEWSGRGVGLDAVANETEKMGGTIAISSEYGTSISITVPLITTEYNYKED